MYNTISQRCISQQLSDKVCICVCVTGLQGDMLTETDAGKTTYTLFSKHHFQSVSYIHVCTHSHMSMTWITQLWCVWCDSNTDYCCYCITYGVKRCHVEFSCKQTRSLRELSIEVKQRCWMYFLHVKSFAIVFYFNIFNPTLFMFAGISIFSPCF